MKLEKLFIPISVILAGLIIGFFIFISASKNNQSSTNITPTPEVTTVPTQTQTPTATPTTSVLPTADDLSAIKQALAARLSVSADSLDVSITKNTGSYAKGNVKEKTSEVGGGYYLAAKVSGKWVIVYDGQSTPTCAQISSYNFPSDMVPECLNSTGQVIQR